MENSLEKTAIRFGSNVAEEIFSQFEMSDGNDIVKCLINGFKFYYEGNEEATWGIEKFSMRVKDILSWLEKQDEQGNNEDEAMLHRFSFYSYKDEPNILYLAGLYVNDEYRNKGIGTKILKIADEVAVSMKCSSILLKTEIGSNAERLYKNNGYSVFRMEENQVWLEKQCEQKYTNNQFTPEQANILDRHIDKFLEEKPAWSEDEKIRKSLINYVHCYGDAGDFTKKEFIAWIEKQGESTDILADAVLGDNNDGLIADTIRYKKQTEQKSEPKFKVGDWVVYHRNDSSTEIMNVYDIRDNRYYFNDNIHFSWSVKECDEKYHLWTIQDAKDGDVLVTGNKNIFIFKSISDCTVYDYCGLYFGKFIEYPSTVNGSTAVQLPIGYTPATKEQRDALMKAMADAGYAFDFNKKVLKKIEQKSTDEEMKETLRTEYEKGRADAIAEMQKLVWSEEDTEISSMLIELVESKEESMEAKVEFITWLRSIKNKILPKPKQEWSEEDEKILKGIIECGEHHIYLDLEDVNWLKSLKYRYAWKPSEEQMRILDLAIRCGINRGTTEETTLISLFNDLKKLREE